MICFKLPYFSHLMCLSCWGQICVCVCLCDEQRSQQVCVCTQKALLYWLHWTGLDQVGLGHQMRPEVKGGGVQVWAGTQRWLRQHKQHADTVTGNTAIIIILIILIVIILLFKVLLKTLRLYKKEENRIFALMKNTFLVFFPPPTKKVLIQENKYSKKAKK